MSEYIIIVLVLSWVFGFWVTFSDNYSEAHKRVFDELKAGIKQECYGRNDSILCKTYYEKNIEIFNAIEIFTRSECNFGVDIYTDNVKNIYGWPPKIKNLHNAVKMIENMFHPTFSCRDTIRQILKKWVI